MTMLSYTQIIAVLVSFLYFFHRRRCCKNPIFIDWPFLGMLPSLLCNLWQIHDFVKQALKAQAGTANFKGPWFTSLNYLFTCDPINIQYIMSKNFNNYEKGEFRENFQVLGDGILAAESETWKYSRPLLHSLFKKKSFQDLSEKILQNKVQSRLLPVLDYVQRQGMEVDLQDVFQRFTFDYSCSLIFGYDPQSLAIDFPEVAIAKAFIEAEEFTFRRHVVPQSFWKLQKWLQIGAEKKLAAACKTFDKFLYERITSKREELSRFNKSNEEDDLLATLLKQDDQEGKEQFDYKFLKDTTSNLLIAGRETITAALAWFFWLVATHPLVEAKILQEIKDKIVEKGENPSMLGVKDLKNLVYLHAAISEALRLFPPVPFNFKQAIESDILPSGHGVEPKTKIVLSFYSVGRHEDIWGKDCLEFKPERWISDQTKGGNIVNVPSHEFTSFGSGPRTCLGKNLSFIVLKIVVTAIMWNYHIHVVEDHPVSPAISTALLMKCGLKVKITRRG